VDDKTDILERNGLAAAASFVLRRGEPPSEEMMGFLRLMQLSGGRGEWGLGVGGCV
jgi:[ribulose-bisphosphate carboxylase]-lysine N-methyltransferase